MQKWSLIGAVLLMGAASPAIGAPVYLDCVLQREKGPQPWTLSLNEEAGTVTATHPMATYTEKASFTPDAVLWGSEMVQNSVDRSTLAFTQTLSIGSTYKKTEQGHCKLSERKRAF